MAFENGLGSVDDGDFAILTAGNEVCRCFVEGADGGYLRAEGGGYGAGVGGYGVDVGVVAAGDVIGW